MYLFIGSSQRQRPRAHVGPSHTGAGLDDDIFRRLIGAVSDRFHTDPVFRRQQLPSNSRLHQIAQDIIAGASAESTGLPREQFDAWSAEMLRMVITLLEEAFRPPPPTQVFLLFMFFN